MNEEYTPFEEWFETFDRDGGELMLYNTIDLEAAFEAGAAAGYAKGVTTMREKSAEVANSMAIDCPSDKCPEYTDMDDCMYKETGFCIAAAIRQIEVT